MGHEHATDPVSWRAAIAGGVILAIGLAPLGVLLTQRRLSMIGDAVAHGMLPGVAIALLVAGASFVTLNLGALAAGLVVALTAGFVSRSTGQSEDAALAAIYLTALALGLAVLTRSGVDAEEITHLLFGMERPLGEEGLLAAAGATTVTLFVLASIWPALVLDVADRGFLRSVSRTGAVAQGVFLALVVLMLTAAFQAVGTVMSVGLLILPAAAARFWSEGLLTRVGVAAGLGAVAAVIGALAAMEFDIGPGPGMVLAAAAIYLASVAFGPVDGLITRRAPRRHYAG